MLKEFSTPLSSQDKERLDYVYQVVEIVKNEPNKTVITDSNFFRFERNPVEDTVIGFLSHYKRGLSIKCNYSDYINNKNIQSTLDGLKIDSEKFWFLILFAYDFSESYCFHNYKHIDLDLQIDEFIEAINTHHKDIVDNKKVMSLRLEVDGRKNFSTNDLNLISFISNACKSAKKNNILFSFHEELTTESNSVHVWYFAQLFIKFFEKNQHFKAKSKNHDIVSFNKKLLISRLIYFTRISRNELYDKSDETLKGMLKQYKNKKLNMPRNNTYW